MQTAKSFKMGRRQ